ncbi:MAG: hypothetical protein DDT37_00380 [Firmicutes bacterium]|nr:hypothetical protein [candidate division NPL-UPA2 bacterium]MBT9155413.1 hypothetical protein [candidate division NPL-UPA2 bacterium]
MKRSVSLLLVLLVAVVAWFLARPGGGDDLKTAMPFTEFQQATAERVPVFVMFTSDT